MDLAQEFNQQFNKKWSAAPVNAGFLGCLQSTAEQSLVDREVSRICTAISELEKELQMHIERLAPVLLNESLGNKTGDQESGDTERDRGQLGNRLAASARQIDHLHSMLVSLRYRLTI